MKKQAMNRPPRRKINFQTLKRLLQAAKPYWVAIILTFVFVAAYVVIEIIAPQYLKQLTDEITNHAATQNIDMEAIAHLGIILIVFYALTALFFFLSGYLSNYVVQHLTYDMRKAIAEKIHKLPLSYFDRHAQGDIMSRVTNDVDSVSQNLDQTLTMLLSSVVMIFGSLIAMFITAWQMALVALISLPLLLIFTAVDMRLAMPLFRKRSKKTGVVNGIVEENFSGSLVIKAFAAEERIEKEFDKENEELGSAMKNAQIIGGMIMPIMNFVSYFTYALILCAGGLMIANDAGGVTFGTLTAFLVYARLFQQPLTQISQAINALQTISAAYGRVSEFLNEEEIAPEQANLAYLDPKTIRGEIVFDHVNFSYDGKKTIIHDFSASVKAGSKVAIVGPTGAGKTTMVNLLMRFYELSGGQIRIDGIPLSSLKRENIRDIFGMVLQDSWMFEGTMRENILYNSPSLPDSELKEICKKANLYYFIKTLPNGFSSVLSDQNALSGGQKQLLTIARAMVRNAPLLILDEATSNVDTRTEELIQEAMDSLTKGRTSFVIAHRLSTIKNADLILVMKDGNIIEQGTHESLLEKKGFYAEMYESQFQYE